MRLHLRHKAGKLLRLSQEVHRILRVWRALSPDDALVDLADELASLGVRRWVLQPFRPTGCANEALVAAAPRGARIGEALLARLRERVPGVEVRG